MSTSKRALLIGCNYSGANQLYGCINDIIQLKGLLIDAYGFAPSEIVTLRDDDPSNMPRKARIVQELHALVAANPANAVIVYSGHGTQMADASGEEVDGKDEVIVPCDLQPIKDDELNAILTPFKGSGLAIFDCCHSGTILDLSFNGVKTTSSVATATSGLICFSGCQDNDYSMETFSEISGLPQGAMTAGLIAVLRRLKYFPAVDTLWTELKKELRMNGFTQIPQLSASKELTRATPFPLAKPVDVAGQTSELQTQIAALQKENATLKTAAAASTTQIAALQKENATLKTAAAASTTQIATLQKENATLKTAAARIPSLEAQLRSQQVQAAQVPVLQRQIRDQQALLGQIPTLKAQLATLHAQLATMQRQLAAKK